MVAIGSVGASNAGAAGTASRRSSGRGRSSVPFSLEAAGATRSVLSTSRGGRSVRSGLSMVTARSRPVVSLSASDRVLSPPSPSASSRYGFGSAPGSVPARLDGRGLRPRRGGRRRSVIHCGGQRWISITDRPLQSRTIPCPAVIVAATPWTSAVRPHRRLKRVRSERDVDGIVVTRRELRRYRRRADDTRESGDAGATARLSLPGPARSHENQDLGS